MLLKAWGAIGSNSWNREMWRYSVNNIPLLLLGKMSFHVGKKSYVTKKFWSGEMLNKRHFGYNPLKKNYIEEKNESKKERKKERAKEEKGLKGFELGLYRNLFSFIFSRTKTSLWRKFFPIFLIGPAATFHFCDCLSQHCNVLCALSCNRSMLGR